MKTKTPIILALIILTLVLITACTSEDQTVEITEEDLEIVRNLSFDDVKENITITTEDFVDDYSYLTIADLEFIQDKLAVDDINEVKKFNNIEMRLGLKINSEEAQIDVEDENNFREFVSGIEEELLNTLMIERPYEFSRIITTSIAFEDQEYNLHHSSISGNIRDSEIITALRNEESEAEKAALDKTFELIGKDKEAYQLFKFGIMEDLDYFVIYFHEHSIDEEPNLTIEELSEKLYTLVTEDEDFEEYIDNRAKELVIAFNDRSFNYDLKD